MEHVKNNHAGSVEILAVAEGTTARAAVENLVVNGDFSANLEGWTRTGLVSAISEKASLARGATLGQRVAVPAGTRQVQVAFDITAYAGAGYVSFGQGESQRFASNGSYDVVLQVGGSADSPELLFQTSPGSFELDNVSLTPLADGSCEPEELVANGGFDEGLSGWETGGISVVAGAARSGPYWTLAQDLPAMRPGSTGVIEFTVSGSDGGDGTVVLSGINRFVFAGDGVKQASFIVPDDQVGGVRLRLDLPACGLDNVSVMACPA